MGRVRKHRQGHWEGILGGPDVPELEYEIRGADTLALRVRALGPELKSQIIGILGEAAAVAEAEWKGNIPIAAALFRARSSSTKFASLLERPVVAASTRSS